MEKMQALKSTTLDSRIIFWPSLVDMLISVLMIFLLVYFLHATLGIEDIEAQTVRKNQELFTAVFETDFAKEIGENTIAIEERLSLTQITFSDRVLFASGEYELQRSGQDALMRCAAVFIKARESGYKQIQVEGHTDDRPIPPRSLYPRDNWELSTGRAISVVKFLTEKAGLDAKVFSANGYSHYEQVAPNNNEQNRAKNRRIEIRVFFVTPNER